MWTALYNSSTIYWPCAAGKENKKRKKQKIGTYPLQRDLEDPTQFPDPDCDQISVSAEKIIINQSETVIMFMF